MILKGWPEQVKKGIRISDREKNIGDTNNPYFVRVDKIPEYLQDRETVQYINMYIRTKRWGLPFDGGWADQPVWIMDILDILEEMDIKYGQRTTNN